MIARAIAWSAAHPGLVFALALLLAAFGARARRTLTADVVPDLADPQIAVVAEWMGHPADVVARDVTTVLADSLGQIPGATAVRGTSMAEMAYLDVVFAGSERLSAGRAQIAKRVAKLRTRLPPNVRISIGPVTASTGWVYQYALVDPTHGQNAVSLRRLHQRVLRPALARVPGVAEVAVVGGARQELIVEAKPEQLRAEGLAFSDLDAQLRALLSVSRAPAQAELERASIALPGTQPRKVALSDLARVRLAKEMPSGVAELDDASNVVGGTVIAARGARLASVVNGVVAALRSVRAQLPPGVQVVTTYDRLALAAQVEQTLSRALLEEVAVVVLVIVAFLLHARSALIPLLTLPLVLLLTYAALWALGVPATVMSLSGIGIALGMAIDADIVALEACHRELEALPAAPSARERRAALIAAASKLSPAILTSLIIAALSFLPVFVFDGETGRLLAPLALAKTLVIAAAALVALSVAPALRDRLLGGAVRPELDNPLTRSLVAGYRPFVHFALSRPRLSLVTAACAVASALPLASQLGGEFLPRIDEGDLLFMPTTMPGLSAADGDAELRAQDRVLRSFPQVASVFGKLGRAETATDPAPLSMVETTIQLAPRSAWPLERHSRWYSSWAPAPVRSALAWIWPELRACSTVELVARLDRATRRPGWVNAWTAPARARMDMMATGVRTPVGIRIVAAEPRRLALLGGAVRALSAEVPGVRTAVFEALGGQPWLAFEPDRAALQRLDVDPALASSTADAAIAGGVVGELQRADERVRVRLLPDTAVRGPADLLRSATVRSRSTAAPIALGLLGRAVVVDRPATVRNEHGALAAYVHVDLTDGRDPARYVDDASARIDRALAEGTLELQQGERIEWTGQYALLKAGQRRLAWVVALAAASMLGLLVLLFRSLVAALIVFASVPFALVGSVWTLFLLGYPFSAPVWVGLLSVVGLAMQTAVVLVVYIDEAFHRELRAGRIRTRADVVAAHAEGAVRRLRPKVMTIATMAAGLLPLLWQQGPGSEIVKRIAAPMLGGLATSAILTLEVLPVLFTLWRCRQLNRAQASGLSLGDFVGATPPWAGISRV